MGGMKNMNFPETETELQDFEAQGEKLASRLSLLLLSLTMVRGLAGANLFSLFIPWISGYLIGLGIQGYCAAPRRVPSKKLVEQEQNWLFGIDAQAGFESEKYSLVRNRLILQRMERWKFVMHLGVLLLILDFLSKAPPFLSDYTGFFLIAELVLVAVHALYAFPSPDDLARRERKAGEAIRRELELLTPEKRKNEEKPKRGYALGDDGEIVEIEDDEQVIASHPDAHQRFVDGDL
jgi:hypothetical protein